MIRKTFYLVLLLTCCCLLITACKDDGAQQTAEEQAQQSTGITSAAAASQAAGNQTPLPADDPMAGLTSIHIDEMRDLWENCDFIDIIFYGNRMSLTQGDMESIRRTIGYLIPPPIQHNPACKPMGRITFMVKGDIRQEADIYAGDGCNYFIWMKNNKPAHINALTPEGAQFFVNVVSRGHEMFQQQQQQQQNQ